MFNSTVLVGHVSLTIKQLSINTVVTNNKPTLVQLHIDQSLNKHTSIRPKGISLYCIHK